MIAPQTREYEVKKILVALTSVVALVAVAVPMALAASAPAPKATGDVTWDYKGLVTGHVSFDANQKTGGSLDYQNSNGMWLHGVVSSYRQIDPHTAVGCHVGRFHKLRDTPMVVLATAHPAKFPDAVEAACGIRPMLPARLSDLMAKPERFDILPNELGAIQSYVVERA